MYEQAGARAAGRRSAGGGWNVNFGGGGRGGFRTMTEGRDAGDVRRRAIRSPTSSTRSSAAAAAARRDGAAAARGRARARQGRDVEQEIELPRGRVSRHDAPAARSSTTATRARSTSGFRPASATARASGSPAKANTAAGGAKSGDLYLRIRLAPHPQFERKGTRPLHARAVPLTTAVLGGEAEVPTLGGKSLRLKIPPTTQNGQVFRLKGHGMPVVGKPDEHGDLYATRRRPAADAADAEQREHFEALQKLGREAALSDSRSVRSTS